MTKPVCVLWLNEHQLFEQALQRAGMSRDFSWDASAQEYVKVYERAKAGHRPRLVDSQGHGEQNGIRKGQDLHRQ